LLTRNLHDVFGEKQSARRRAALDIVVTEDCVFWESTGAEQRLIASRQLSGRQPQLLM
jgi:hypothetical protein